MTPHRLLRGWLPHLALLALVVAECAAFVAGHQSDDELRRDWNEGDRFERLWALHVMTNRGELDPDEFDPAFMRALLADDDLRIREFGFSYDMTKIRPPKIQATYYSENFEGTVGHRIRCYFLNARKVGGPRVGAGMKLQLDEFRWFLDSVAGRALPEGDIWFHIGLRKTGMAQRRGIIDAAGNLLYPNSGGASDGAPVEENTESPEGGDSSPPTQPNGG
ncbi:MAG: hypothetical protein ACI835_000726 [Planctomycetota bacterium]|jgi:hypothetical protein